MPGINFYGYFRGASDPHITVLQKAMQAACTLETHTAKIDYQAEGSVLGWSAYEVYPLRRMDEGDLVLWLDGRIYGKTDAEIQKELAGLAQGIFGAWGSSQDRLRSWMLSTDGEFVVAAHHKPTGRWAFWNDVFSRLPLYQYRTDRGIVLSRNIQYMAALREPKQYDRMAIAQFFLFDFAMGRRTFLEGVERIPTATLIRVDPKASETATETLHVLNFERKDHADKSIDENARRIAELFVSGCRNRILPGDSPVMCISGGMDSRAVAAGLKKAGVEYPALSWLDFRGVSAPEVKIAEQVARTLGVSWTRFELRPALGKDLLEALRFKLGQVYLSSAHLHQHHRNAMKLGGPRTVYITGSGGDRINHDMRPPRLLTRDDELAETIFEYARLSGRGDLLMEDISRLTGLSTDEILHELNRELQSYPERESNQKYVHFIFHGQSIKRHHEGDDRVRNFFWSTAPYWSVPLFLYMSHCPDDQKKNHALYARYLRELHPTLGSIERVINRRAYSIPIGVVEPEYQEPKPTVWRTIYRPIKRSWKRIRRVFIPSTQPTGPRLFVHPSDLLECMRVQAASSAAVRATLSAEAIGEILANAGRYSAEGIAVLFTVMSAVEYMSEGRSTIEQFQDKVMDTYA